MDDEELKVVWIILLVAIALLVGFALGLWVMQGDYRNQAIERGYAGFNQITGQWEWKDE